MDDDAQQKAEEAHDLAKKAHEIAELAHDLAKEADEFLFKVPPGAIPGEVSLASKLRRMVRAWERTSWLTRAIIYLIPMLAGLGAGLGAILGWFSL